MTAGTANRCGGAGGAGRPDRAATTGIREADRARRQAAATAVPTARAIAVAISGHGRWNGSMTCPALACSRGAYAAQAAKPTAAPVSAPAAPTAAPPVTMTRRMLRSVAPTAASMPRARSRRCAITVNPAIATSPMKISPNTASTSTVAAGLRLGGALRVIGWPRICCAPPGKCSGPRPKNALRFSLNRTVTWVGAVTWPGATRANSSRRFAGFPPGRPRAAPCRPRATRRRFSG